MSTLRQSVLVRAPPAAVHAALLDSASLSRVLGHTCVSSAEPGGIFGLWDGLISGHNVKVSPTEIAQAWHYVTPGWPPEVDSLLVLQFSAEGEGTRISLSQTNIPLPCGVAVEQHWRDHVWPGVKALLEKPIRHEVGIRGWLARAR